MHAVTDAHEMPDSLGLKPSPGLGMVCRIQGVPFQRSASTNVCPLAAVQLPTAKHAMLDVHDTPAKEAETAAGGFGEVWTTQRVPFQRSASVRPFPLELVEPLPTAMHSVAEGHDTALSAPLSSPLA